MVFTDLLLLFNLGAWLRMLDILLQIIWLSLSLVGILPLALVHASIRGSFLLLKLLLLLPVIADAAGVALPTATDNKAQSVGQLGW